MPRYETVGTDNRKSFVQSLGEENFEGMTLTSEDRGKSNEVY